MPGQQAKALELHLHLHSLCSDVVCGPAQRPLSNQPALPWAWLLNRPCRDTKGKLGEQTLVGDSKNRRV